MAEFLSSQAAATPTFRRRVTPRPKEGDNRHTTDRDLERPPVTASSRASSWLATGSGTPFLRKVEPARGPGTKARPCWILAATPLWTLGGKGGVSSILCSSVS